MNTSSETHGNVPRSAGRLWWLAGLAFVALAQGCCPCREKPLEPLIRLQDVRLHMLTTERMEFLVDFNVYNRNSHDLKLARLDYVLQIKGENYLEGAIDDRAGLFKPEQEKIISSYADISAKRMSRTVQEAIRKNIEFNVQGVAIFILDDANQLINMRFGMLGAMHKVTPPRFRFRQVHLPRDANDDLYVDFDVENPNAFVLPMSYLKGKLTSGGRWLGDVDQANLEDLPPYAIRPVTIAAKPRMRDREGIIATDWEQVPAPDFVGEIGLVRAVSLLQPPERPRAVPEAMIRTGTPVSPPRPAAATQPTP